MGRTIVVGAGVIGLACAWELRKRGEEVLVIERGLPGEACSRGNAGWVVPSMSAPIPAPGLAQTTLRWMVKPDSPLYIRPRLDPAFAAWMWRFWRSCRPAQYAAGLDAVAGLARRTMELFDAWQAEGVRFEMHRCGLLYAGLSSAVVERAAQEVQLLERFGYRRPVLLSANELRDMEPALSDAVAGGFLVEEERHVRPEDLCAGLAAALQEAGVEIASGVEMSGAERRDGAIRRVWTTEGALEGERVLLAAGAWTGRLAGLLGRPLPVEAGKGYSITVAAPERRVQRPLDLIEARVAVTPFDGALRLAGTMELSGLNLDLRRERVEAIRRAGERFLGNGWSRGTGETVWVGMRPLTPDGLPILGRLPGLDNTWVAAGHAMLGVTLAPATGASIAAVMTGADPGVELHACDPARFF